MMAEDVLHLLATEGIAAYVQPAVDVDPVTRSAVLPAGLSDLRSQLPGSRPIAWMS
jgi:hypothetical protein